MALFPLTLKAGKTNSAGRSRNDRGVEVPLSNNTILDELIYQEAAGTLSFRDVRYLLIRPDTLGSFQSNLAKRFGEEVTGEIIYAGGYEGGKRSGLRYREEFKLNAREAVEFMCKMGGQIGWGDFRLQELETTKPHLIVEVAHSPFAEGYPDTPVLGVCHFIRGVLGGLAEGLFNIQVDALEAKCVARGDHICRFEVSGVA
jgi:predicted hydrocarbon binding protein